MNNTPMDYTCSACGRGYSAIFHCADRKSGMCRYTKTWSGRKGGLFVLIGFGLSWAIGFFSQATWLIPFVIVLSALMWFLTVDAQLVDQAAGVALEHTTVAELEIKRSLRTKGQPVSVDIAPVEPIQYPLSIVEAAEAPFEGVGSNERAASIVRAALLGLVLKDLIVIRPIRNCTSSLLKPLPVASSDYYIVVVDDDGRRGLLAGSLEKLLLQAVASCRRNPVPRESWLEGPTIYELVRRVYERDEDHPGSWLIELVERNAYTHGLNRIERSGFLGLSKKAVWDGPTAAALLEDHAVMQKTFARALQSNPDLWSTIYTEVLRGIKSRTDSGD